MGSGFGAEDSLDSSLFSALVGYLTYLSLLYLTELFDRQ